MFVVPRMVGHFAMVDIVSARFAVFGAVSALAEHWHEVERRRAGELCFSSCFFGVGIGSLLAVGLNYTPLVSP